MRLWFPRIREGQLHAEVGVIIDIWREVVVSLCELVIGFNMTEFLLEIRVSVKRVFTPILRLAFTPLNYDTGFFIKAFLNLLIKCSDTLIVFISLGLNIGDPGDSHS